MTKELQELKEGINALLKAGMPKEEIDKITNLSKACDTIAEQQDKTAKELNDFKNDYIELVKSAGGTAKYDGQDKANPAPKSFEECVQEAIKLK